MKKLKFYLQHLDGVWSFPLAISIFWLFGLLLNSFGGYGVGTYDPGFIQPLFLAVGVVIGATNFAVWGLYFTFKGIYRYLYGQKKEGVRINYSKKDWTKITVWQRYVIAFGVFFFFFSAIILVYLKLV